jgi:hypothetical protein
VVNNPEIVAAIYLVAGVLFLGGFVIGALTTLARVLYYRIHNIRRPRLLTRDVVVWGGLAVSFALISAVRFLPAEVRMQFTAGNVGWALATSIPAVAAVLTYVYFELWVIERTQVEDTTAREASVQENIELTREAGDKADAAYREANSVNTKIANLTELVSHKEDKP